MEPIGFKSKPSLATSYPFANQTEIHKKFTNETYQLSIRWGIFRIFHCPVIATMPEFEFERAFNYRCLEAAVFERTSFKSQ